MIDPERAAKYKGPWYTFLRFIGWGIPPWLGRYDFLTQLSNRRWGEDDPLGVPDLSLRRVEEFRSAPPGWIAFGRETPYLQVTRLDGS